MSNPDGLSLRDFDPQPHLLRLKAGVLLLARDLDDPNFARALVLLCQHTDEGSYGLILNRPVKIPVHEIFDTEGLLPDQRGVHKFYVGGPVATEELQVLQLQTEIPDDTTEIVTGLHVGGRFNDLTALLSADPKQVRLFLGYSGWGSGQLPHEIEAGAWEVFEADIPALLLGPEERLLGSSEVLRTYLLSGQP